MSEKVDAFIAEDDETDAFLLERAFRETCEHPKLHFVRDGLELVESLEAKAREEGGRLPAVIVLDLKMPRMNGMDVLEWRKSQPVLGCIPVIVFSSSLQDEDIERSYTLGANLFLSKPNSTKDRAEIARFISRWITLGRPPIAATGGVRAAERARMSWGLPNS